MKEVLQFVFSEPWHYIGTAILLAIFACWKPVDITVLNGRIEQKDDDK